MEEICFWNQPPNLYIRNVVEKNSLPKTKSAELNVQGSTLHTGTVSWVWLCKQCLKKTASMDTREQN